jgi:hypothetical protein
MEEREILSALFPAHADLQPILKQLREKYGLPDLGLLDKNLAGLLLSNKDIPWEEIKKEIRAEVEAGSEFFPPQIKPIQQFAQTNQAALEDPKKIVEAIQPTQEDIQAVTVAMLSLIKPMAQTYSRMVDDVCKLLFVYLATGETEEIPLDWLGAVYTSSMFGEPIVVAMAGQLSNPDEIIARFTAEIHRVFGRNRPKVTSGFANMAKYLRRRFEGVGLYRLADEYIKLNPKEYTGSRTGPAFRDYRSGVIGRLKKSLARYEKKVLELIGDNSKT